MRQVRGKENSGGGKARRQSKDYFFGIEPTPGLSKVGNNMYGATDASGTAIVGTVGSGVGKIFTNSLEMS
ncbi:hypothetical protein, partial [Desulfobacula sp.]|uniref:hypothetical protein n=1 Tax=Desulfobacula sp. TaxID=2593537 RepID=UPI0025C4C0ED